MGLTRIVEPHKIVTRFDSSFMGIFKPGIDRNNQRIFTSQTMEVANIGLSRQVDNRIDLRQGSFRLM